MVTVSFKWLTGMKMVMLQLRVFTKYGSATLDKDSPHYTDQAYLFSDMKMKPSFIELDSIKKYLKKSYNPLINIIT